MADAPDKPVYLLTGSERPKIETALARLRMHFVPEAIDAVSALDTGGEEVVARCNAGSLFGDGRLVIVVDVDGRRDGDGRLRGGWKAADVDAIVSYLKSPAPASVLALVGEDVKASTALRKACANAGEVLEWSVQKGKLQGWIADQFRRRGVDADPEACGALLHLVGEDPQALAVEIDKLATWAAGQPIGTLEVEALTAATAEPPTYEITDAWAERDTARALDASETIFEQEVKTRRDNAARLAAALGGHVGRLRLVKRLAEDGVQSRDAAERLRMNPYYVRKLYGQAERFSDEQLRSSVVRLAELDGALKGQSKLSPDLEVQRALVELAQRPDSPKRAV